MINKLKTKTPQQETPTIFRNNKHKDKNKAATVKNKQIKLQLLRQQIFCDY